MIPDDHVAGVLASLMPETRNVRTDGFLLRDEISDLCSADSGGHRRSDYASPVTLICFNVNLRLLPYQPARNFGICRVLTGTLLKSLFGMSMCLMDKICDDSHAKVPDPETIISLAVKGGISTMLRFAVRSRSIVVHDDGCVGWALDFLVASLEGCRNEPAHATSHLSLVGHVNLFTIQTGIA